MTYYKLAAISKMSLQDLPVCLFACMNVYILILALEEKLLFFFVWHMLFDVYIYIYIFPLASEERFLSFVAVPSGTNGGNLEAGHNVYTSQLYFASTVSSPLVILYSSNKHVKSMYNHIKIK